MWPLIIVGKTTYGGTLVGPSSISCSLVQLGMAHTMSWFSCMPVGSMGCPACPPDLTHTNADKVQRPCLSLSTLSSCLCMCWQVLQPDSAWLLPSPSSHKCQVNSCQLSSMIQPDLAHQHSLLSMYTSGCCRTTEASSQVPFRSCSPHFLFMF